MSEALEEKHEQLIEALEFSRLGFWRWDAVTDLVTLSTRAAEIFGIPAGSHTTWTAMRGLLLEPDRDRARAAVEAAIQRRSDYAIYYRVKRPSDGQVVWVEARGRAQYADEAVVGMIGIVEDVTARKTQETVLAEERSSLEGRFQLLVEGVTDYAIFMLDPTGIVTNWNTGAERIKGYHTDEIVGRHFSRFYTADDQASGVPQRGLDTAAWEVKADWTVDLSKPDFVGKSALAAKKGKERSFIAGLEVDTDRAIEPLSKITVDGKQVGVVTSTTFSKHLMKSLAMAQIEPAYTKLGTEVVVHDKGEWPATVVRMPFYDPLRLRTHPK